MVMDVRNSFRCRLQLKRLLRNLQKKEKQKQLFRKLLFNQPYDLNSQNVLKQNYSLRDNSR